ncbi:DUF742 domain-containing protein [Actinomadura sp. 21ATH]|uniref:DUF742 domain-containing protein n=1 Tax=Actinomadura sp. 21ATH TaxID=1735444 RepID=UPI0035BF6C9A
MMPPEDPAEERRQPEDLYTAERLLDDRAGPMVRPYVMTSGRLEPTRGDFDLITLVVAIAGSGEAEIGLGPEHQAILQLSQSVISVAELTGHLNLPVATVRVLLGDLLDKGFITMQEPEPEADMHDIRLYKAVIDGLRAL